MDLTDLRRTINLCKESINTATQDLTKLTGRSFDKSADHRSFSNTATSNRDNATSNTRFMTKRRNTYEDEIPIEIKKSRSDKEMPALNSVVQMTKGRTRNDAIIELKTKENPKEKERCKRLFGHLMGTLNSIKKEAEKSTNDPQQLTRLKIEKKVEEDHKQISETIQREQNELIRMKRERQMDLKILNQRYRAADAFERWRIQKEKMKGFIRTNKMPFVFYKPKIINEEAQLRIDQTAQEIDSMIESRKNKLEAEIDRVVKKHANVNRDIGNVGLDEEADENALGDDVYHGSSLSVVAAGDNGTRQENRGSEFGSEDYDDMIEEIEITMHDDEERGAAAVVKVDVEVVKVEEELCVDEEADEKYVEDVERAIEELEMETEEQLTQEQQQTSDETLPDRE